MHRHDLDPISLIAGLVFLGLGLAFLIDLTTGVNVDVRYVWPVLLIAAGISGLLATRSRAAADIPPVSRGDPGSPRA